MYIPALSQLDQSFTPPRKWFSSQGLYYLLVLLQSWRVRLILDVTGDTHVDTKKVTHNQIVCANVLTLEGKNCKWSWGLGSFSISAIKTVDKVKTKYFHEHKFKKKTSVQRRLVLFGVEWNWVCESWKNNCFCRLTHWHTNPHCWIIN